MLRIAYNSQKIRKKFGRQCCWTSKTNWKEPGRLWKSSTCPSLETSMSPLSIIETSREKWCTTRTEREWPMTLNVLSCINNKGPLLTKLHATSKSNSLAYSLLTGQEVVVTPSYMKRFYIVCVGKGILRWHVLGAELLLCCWKAAALAIRDSACLCQCLARTSPRLSKLRVHEQRCYGNRA